MDQLGQFFSNSLIDALLLGAIGVILLAAERYDKKYHPDTWQQQWWGMTSKGPVGFTIPLFFFFSGLMFLAYMGVF